MSDYTINFISATTPGANTSGTFDDNGDLPMQMQQLVDYFKSDGLSVRSLNVSDWTELNIVVDGDTYFYTR